MPRKQYVPTIRRKRKVTKVPARRPGMRMRPRNNRIARPISSLPFPKVKTCTLVYKYPGYTLGSSIGGLVTQRFKCNSMFDFDYDNNMGNKQPLYYDQLFSDTGPYKYYKVNAWRTKITVTNLSSQALHCYYDQGAIGSFVDSDTQLEAQNRPGVIYRLLTGAANARPQAVFQSYKTLKSFAPNKISSGLDYGAAWNADPINTIFSSLLVGNLSVVDTTAFNVVFTVEHTFYATCYLNDAAQS